MQTATEIIETTSDGEPMAVVVCEPTEGEHPTVMMFMDAPGVRTATRTFAERLAGEGYRVLLPDLYHRKGRLLHFEPDAVAANPDLRNDLWALLGSLTDDGIQADADAALAAAGDDGSSPLATIGFCLGARAIYRYMMRMPERVVAGATWHPSFLADDEPDSPHLTAGGITQPMYIGIGDADQVQSIALHQRFFDAVEPLPHVEVEIFPGADHGFSWPDAPSYNENAATTSWGKTTALFASAFVR